VPQPRRRGRHADAPTADVLAAIADITPKTVDEWVEVIAEPHDAVVTGKVGLVDRRANQPVRTRTTRALCQQQKRMSERRCDGAF